MLWDVTVELADGGQVTIHKVEADGFKKAGHLASVQAAIEFGTVEEVVSVSEHKPAEEKHTCLVDLSNIFRIHWHASEQDEVGSAYRKTVRFIENHASNFDHVGVCLDWPPYQRQSIMKEYKANREKASTVMKEQMRQTIDRIRELGYHIFRAEGYEADDIIATLVEHTENQGIEVIVFSGDKDLMQLVSPNTKIFSPMTQQKYGQDEVLEKFGVHPELVADLLAIIGDKSDNIPGIKGAGTKIAAGWLNEYGDLDGVIANAHRISRKQPGGDGKTLGEAILENRDELNKWHGLTKLMIDAPIDAKQLFAPMNPQHKEGQPELDLDSMPGEEEEPPHPAEESAQADDPGPNGGETTQSAQPAVSVDGPESGATPGVQGPDPEPPTAPEVVEPDVVIPPAQTAMVKRNPDYDRALEPADMGQAWGLAKSMHRSRMFGDFPNPEAILAIVMTGRTFGMDAVSSLRGFHFVKGKASPSAQLLIGLVKRHPACEYFRIKEQADDRATWETKRRDEPEPVTMTFTLEDAKRAGLLGNDNWKKRPGMMCLWRAGTQLARVVYPDITSGLYTPDELEER